MNPFCPKCEATLQDEGAGIYYCNKCSWGGTLEELKSTPHKPTTEEKREFFLDVEKVDDEEISIQGTAKV